MSATICKRLSISTTTFLKTGFISKIHDIPLVTLLDVRWHVVTVEYKINEYFSSYFHFVCEGLFSLACGCIFG